MRLIFTLAAWRDCVKWSQDDPAILARINLLLEECVRHPFTGTGKTEPLRRNLPGWWSREFNREHRLVYGVAGSGKDQTLQVARNRYHY